jgi:2'-5' RNA ligase
VGQLAIVIVPPAKDMAPIEDIRRRFDPHAGRVPAHVTLVFPFEDDAADARLARHVKEAATGLAPFDLVLEGVTCSSDHFLFLMVTQGAEESRDLHDRLYTGFLRPLLSDRAFTPHVTLGRFLTADECAEVMHLIEPMNLQVRTKAESLTIYDSTHLPYRVTREIHFW